MKQLTPKQDTMMTNKKDGSGNFPSLKRQNVSELIPYANNARTHSDEQVVQIAASIKEFGFINPVIVDGDNGIVAGHGRVLAARKLGMEEVPTIEAAWLTDAQRKAYILADNKLAMNAGWDNDLLRVEFKDLENRGFNLSLIGFSNDEISDVFFIPDFEPVGEDEQGRLDQKKPVTCPECGHEFTD